MGGDENLEKSYGDQIIVRLTFLGNHSTGTGDPGMGYPQLYRAYKYKYSNKKTARANMRL